MSPSEQPWTHTWGSELIELFQTLRDTTGVDPRTGAPMSLREIARQATLSHSYVSQVFSGRKRPSAVAAEKIARALRARVEDIRQAGFYAAQLARSASSTTTVNFRLDEFTAADPIRSSSPSGRLGQLLDARAGVVAFAGRDHEIQQLQHWRDSGHPKLSTLLVHGPGGQGKSRLAAHFARMSGVDGWRCSEARHSPDGHPIPQVGSRSPGNGPQHLVLVDYAERWPIHDLLILLGELRRSTARTRVLLLARPDARTWDTAGLVLDDIALMPLANTPDEREIVYLAARDRFAGILGLTDPDDIAPPTELLSGDDYRQVLTIHMAALVAVDARLHRVAIPQQAGKLSEYLVDRERDHWQFMFDNRASGEGTPPAVMARAVFMAALTGPLATGLGTDVLATARLPNPRRTVTDHGLCYPPSQTGFVLEPLYPDRLAEDFLALQLPGTSDTAGDPWAADTPQRILSDRLRQPAIFTARAITVIIESAARWPHVATHLLCPLILANPSAIIATGSAALTRLATISQISTECLTALGDAFPAGRHVGLDIGIAAIAERLIERRLTTTVDSANQASLWVALAARYGNAGQHEAAHEAAQKAVNLYRDIGGHPNDLVLALNEAGTQLALNGHPRDAILLLQDAVDLATATATAASATMADSAVLARVLNAYSIVLAACDREHESLAITQRVVELFRDLATQSDDYQANLALALNNLSVDLSARQDMSAALAATEEALAIYERLYAVAPDATEADLAMALGNHAIRLMNVHQDRDAIAISRRAVMICRRLATVNPTTFRPDLAWTLSILGWAGVAARASADDLDVVLAPMYESIDLYQSLDGPLPVTFSDDRYDCVRETMTLLIEQGNVQHARGLRERLADDV